MKQKDGLVKELTALEKQMGATVKKSAAKKPAAREPAAPKNPPPLGGGDA